MAHHSKGKNMQTDTLVLCDDHARRAEARYRAEGKFVYRMAREPWDPTTYGQCLAEHAPATQRVMVERG